MSHSQARLGLDRDPTSASYARRHVGAFCAAMAPDLRMTAQLLASELVTNALQHGDGDIEMHLSLDGHVLRVTISDESPQPPRRRPAAHGSTGGRGLMLLEAMASSWGVTRHPGDGKAVWFALRTA